MQPARGGITKVLIPQDNAKDLADIPDNVKEGLEIVPVSRVDEVLEHALLEQPEAIEWDQAAYDAKRAAMSGALHESTGPAH